MRKQPKFLGVIVLELVLFIASFRFVDLTPFRFNSEEKLWNSLNLNVSGVAKSIFRQV